MPDVKIGQDGLCSYCSGEKHESWESNVILLEKKKDNFRKQFEIDLEKNRGKYKYDCVIGISGGKDSAYLLYYLAVEKKLKVLAVYIKDLFDGNQALENINVLKNKIPFDLKVISLTDKIYKKIYSQAINLLEQKSFTESVCPVCSRLKMSCILKEAAQNKVPFVFMGFVSGQVNKPDFEWEREIIENRSWVPDIFTGDKDDLLDVFWNPVKYSKPDLSIRIMYPLAILDYNSRDAAIKLFSFLGKKIKSPGCSLFSVLNDLDLDLIGYNTFLRKKAYWIRKGILKTNNIQRLVCFLSTLKFNPFRLYRKILSKGIEKKLNIDFTAILLKNKR